MKKNFSPFFYLKLMNKKSHDRKYRSRNAKCEHLETNKQTNL
jgi:hypothetical protein